MCGTRPHTMARWYFMHGARSGHRTDKTSAEMSLRSTPVVSPYMSISSIRSSLQHIHRRGHCVIDLPFRLFVLSDQNSLLVKRQTDNTTPGGWGLTGGDQNQNNQSIGISELGQKNECRM